MKLGILILALGLVRITPAMADPPFAYRGLCEASAAAFLDATHFAVASDETNILRIYSRGDTTVGGESDLQRFIGHDKSDLEAAARVGDRVYWISSHSFNRSGEDKKKRKVFFATAITNESGVLSLKGAPGTAARSSLRDPLVSAAGVAKSDLNIEGLASTPEGELLVGLRDTLGGKAVIVPFRNPAQVVEQDGAPTFGTPFLLDLEGKGIRSLERVGSGYLIVAGPVSDAGAFALYSWSGVDEKVEPAATTATLDGLRPESAIAVPGSNIVQLLSDDGSSSCSDETTPIDLRGFRSIDIVP